MDYDRFITTEGDCACFRPEGESSPNEFLGGLKRLGLYCKENGIKKAMANATQLTHHRLTVADRFLLGSETAKLWPGGIRFAVVLRADQNDEGHLGLTVANNRGLEMGVFDKESDAVEYLRNEHA
ncbi:MAG TPA: hypothetical protein VF719_01880 [Abditibacteriaceae bacterium]|jgi:hypothetical protein